MICGTIDALPKYGQGVINQNQTDDNIIRIE